ncbi:MAG: DinB family protein [Gemmatimonadales bacterium]
MHPTLAPLAMVYAMNTRLFENCLDGVGEELARARPNDRTNSISFIAAHLVGTRAWMARYLGLTDEPKPFDGALEYGNSIETVGELPTVPEIRDEWDGVSERLEGRLVWLGEADLTAPSTQKFPGVPPTVIGGIAFLLQHESYHIGQLSLLRKFHGLDAMAYRFDG